jgi:hypothetical protein
MVDHPGAAADGAGEQGLVEAIGVKVNFLVLVVLADWALHGETPFALDAFFALISRKNIVVCE